MDRSTALLIVDMQEEMANRTRDGLQRANPQAEEKIAELTAVFRGRGLPVLHVLHDDPNPNSKFRRDLPSGRPMACAAPLEGEAVFWKKGSSGFVGTGLESLLRERGIARLVIVGGLAVMCVNSTVRSAANLGFEVSVAQDALLSFAMASHKGGILDAEVVLDVTLSAIQADFGQVVTTQEVLQKLSAAAPA